MKFIHIADVHLGATPDSVMPWGEQREKEIWASFNKIIDLCNEQKVDLLLIAGDLFHRQPLLRELKEVNYSFSKLETAKVVLMAGNHDYIGSRSYYQEFQWCDKVHMFIKDTIDFIEFPEHKTVVYGLSYLSRDITQPLYDSVKPEHKGKINVLLAHGGDEKNIPFNRRKLIDSGFDYIALGHIHKPEIISDRMAYSGSLEPMDKNETGSRGYIIGDININTSGSLDMEAAGFSNREINTVINISFVPFSSREYKRVDLLVDADTTNGSLLDMARDAIKSMGEQHIYSFYIKGIRDEHVHFNIEGLKSLGNVLDIIDESLPDYDFEALYRDNSDNLIGLFIQRIRQKANQDEIAKKALYYGIEALLGAKR